MSSDDRIGERWIEVMDRIEQLLLDRMELRENERDFLYGLKGRLANYKDQAYVSVRQLNWLSDIEQNYNSWRG